MAEQGFSHGRHEFVEAGELAAARVCDELSLGEAFDQTIEAQFQDDLHIFRADMFELMAKHNAVDSNGGGWAIFRVTAPEEERGVGAIDCYKDVLVFFIPVKNIDAPLSIPNIRIITNESYANDRGDEWLTEDITADFEGDMHYLMDVYSQNQNPDFQGTYAPIFTIDGDNQLRLSHNTVGYTPTLKIKIPDIEETATPFGSYYHLEDRVFVLGKAKQMLQSILDIEPVAHL